MEKISYAQNREDIMLARVLADVREGTYVDVGANHPTDDSVTRYFYDLGWSGINIEPLPALHAELAAQRPRDINLQVAAGAEIGEAAITYAVDYSGLSSLKGVAPDAQRAFGQLRTERISVPVTTLNDILRNHPLDVIHFLKIDVEGFEKDVLQGLDLIQHRPWILVIEATEPMSQRDNSHEWESLVINAAYDLAYHDGLNRFYLAREHSSLKDRFRYPPNVFDGFEPYHQNDLRRDRDAQKERNERLVAQFDAYKQRIERSVSWRVTAPLRALHRLIRR